MANMAWVAGGPQVVLAPGATPCYTDLLQLASKAQDISRSHDPGISNNSRSGFPAICRFCEAAALAVTTGWLSQWRRFLAEVPTKDSVVVWLLLPLSVFWALALAQFEPSHFERSKVVIHDKPSNEMAGYRLQ